MSSRMPSPVRSRVALAAVAALSLAFVPLVVAAPASADAVTTGAVAINEVRSEGTDFIELINRGPVPIDITGWTVVGSDPVQVPLVITTETTLLEPGQYFTFDPDDATIYPAGHFSLDDSVSLTLGFRGDVADTTTWEGMSFPSSSWGRCPNGVGGFAVTKAATPGAANDCEPAVGVTTGAVAINEVRSEGTDFIELINRGPVPIDITGWTVVGSDPVQVPLVITTETTLLEPGQYFTFDPDDATIYPAGHFSLDDSVSLTLGFRGDVADTTTWEGMSFPSSSWGRCPNGVGGFAVTKAATPGAANDCEVSITQPPAPDPNAGSTTEPRALAATGSDGVGLLATAGIALALLAAGALTLMLRRRRLDA